MNTSYGARFCADCKHNVVTAFEILTCKCDLVDIDNEEEYVPELFLPFEDRVGPVPGDVTGQKAVLSCSPEVRMERSPRIQDIEVGAHG